MKFGFWIYLGLFNWALGAPYLLADDVPKFEYICSVYQKNKDGLFKDVVNVVFLPDWQKKSHLFSERQLDIWFEIKPQLDFQGAIESYEMDLTLYKSKETASDQTSSVQEFHVHGPEYSELAFESLVHNIGARCFHRSQRGSKI